jgi:hypothetical protein
MRECGAQVLLCLVILTTIGLDQTRSQLEVGARLRRKGKRIPSLGQQARQIPGIDLMGAITQATDH